MQPTSCDTLVRAGVLVTQDPARRILYDAGIAMSGGTVLHVGSYADVSKAFWPGEFLDLSGCLVLPGLVNAHTHASMSIFRGVADDLPLMTWLTEHIWPVEKSLTAEIVHYGALLACAEMLRTGTTCFCDMYLLEDTVARAVDVAGLRAVLGEGVFAFPSPAYTTVDRAFELVEALHAAYADHPRIRTAVMPHAVYTTTPEILKRCHATAQAHDAVFKLHLAESATETATSREQFGLRPLEYLESLGLLDGRSTFAHGVDFTAEEMSRLAAAGAAIVHCPRSNMKLASGVCKVQELLDAGVTVALGTDGAASNNGLNMFAEMSAAALLQKVSRMDPTALSAQATLDTATLGGAAAMHWPQLGSLAPGQAADLTALDLAAPNMQPLYNPVSQLVYAASGQEVRLTMVAGRVLYRDGAFLSLDYPALLAQAKDIAAWVRKHANQA